MAKRDYSAEIFQKRTRLKKRAATILTAEEIIDSCEHRNPKAEIPFDWILDRLTGSDSSVSRLYSRAPGEMPRCRREVNEKTLVQVDLGD
jgi:hypothetical protein